MSEEPMKLKFLGKIKITGDMIVVTGMHIGASKETVKIGGIDSPVVRDPLTDLPYIPGSSLKGKLRSLSEKALEKDLVRISSKPDINVHVCTDKHCEICRLFGSSKKDEDTKDQKNIPSRLIVRDMLLSNDKELLNIDTGLPYTEWKFENSIDRISSAANPRQIERVPAGARFEFELVYDAEEEAELEEDITRIQMALKLLEQDALGGHGSRGYGKVKFENIRYTGYPKKYYISGDESLILENKSEEEIISVEDIISSFTGEKNA
ncbi:CRISPR-associated RAMP Csm3 [Methanosarcina sp. MTP4]|uniref:type III-A CRISPR-associated RAMP protein Csm3 n=1 Tax=Methanosarcina sp. MTP4 TaxID=1434100 RepID=UPI000615D09D|nr:type III-A CRISPR-associated RAMP protein Csm3 [Methanosarcina sp. MTP4]AKB26314.1 CRISPR-associated RAMP Csm3 [Methanosarcina sp. MTP4]